MIKLYFEAVDGWKETVEAKTLEEAKEIFLHEIGACHASNGIYAVDMYGVKTCYVDGCKLRDITGEE